MQATSVGIALALAACVPPPAATPPNVYVSSEASASINAPVDGDAPGITPRSRAVQVFVDKRIPRPTAVVGVLDFHSEATSEDKGFDELRTYAARLGADAVIGAEFEHGEGGGPSHLSGMAVRFLDP